MSPTNFRKMVWAYYRKNGRHDLPWRKTRDPYRILVSEIMLQQTQVERVVPFYKKFLKKFPTAQRLSAAPLSEVFGVWQGLGYNRRAKLLREAARGLQEIPLSSYRTDLVSQLEKLPGVGPYTARAVAAFAYNQDVVFIETNIRTAVMHHFFRSRDGLIYQTKISDTEIEKILKRALPSGRAREWYSALMDYGSHLKRSGVKLNKKSKHYGKQSKFAGSGREARGAILRALASGSRASSNLTNLLGPARRPQLRTALSALTREGLIEKRGNRFQLPR